MIITRKAAGAFGLFVSCAVVSCYVVTGAADFIPEVFRFVLGSFAFGAAFFVGQQLREVDDTSFYLGISVIGALAGTFVAL